MTLTNDVVTSINNSAVIIIFDATSKSLAQKSQRGIALTLFINEVPDKELLKYEAENIKSEFMIDEHRKAITKGASKAMILE